MNTEGEGTVDEIGTESDQYVAITVADTPTVTNSDIETISKDESVAKVEEQSPPKKPRRETKPSYALGSQTWNNQRGGSYRRDFTMTRRPVNPYVKDAFCRWFNENKSNPDARVEGCTGELTHGFFDMVLTPTKWIDDLFVDEVVFGIRQRIRRYPQIFDQRVVVLDIMWSGIVRGRYGNIMKHRSSDPNRKIEYIDIFEGEDRLDRYVQGFLPPDGTAWDKVHTVYAPLNVQDLHWVMLVFDLNRWELIVLDSSISCNADDAAFERYLTPFMRLVPIVMLKSGLFLICLPPD